MAQMMMVTRKRGLLTTLPTKELLTSLADLPAAFVVPSAAELPLSGALVAGASDGAIVVGSTNSVTPGANGADGASVAAAAGAEAGAAASPAGAGAASSAGAQLTLTRRQKARKAKQRRRLLWEAILEDLREGHSCLYERQKLVRENEEVRRRKDQKTY